MSALANTNTHHANVDTVQLNNEPAVTSISVTARIDYIQRFSKQAVLVIDQNVDVYTQATRQYLVSLSKEKSTQDSNVAFVSASTKLNDIQMRCRLIEQLFANTLFDPEKSLAVSILRLSKQNKESITIVVEHAHALSLQIKYELCQLVDVANKTHNKINVVLFGKEEAAQEAATNRTIFNNKLAIIDAKSGQLFSLDHTKFKNDSVFFTQSFLLKLMIIVISICTLIGASWYVFSEFENFTLTGLPLIKTNENEQVTLSTNSKVNTLLLASGIAEQASTEDVKMALLGKEVLLTKTAEASANTVDILQALALNTVTEAKSIVTTQVKPLLIKSALAKDDLTKHSTTQLKSEQIQVKLIEKEQIKPLTNSNLPLDFPLSLTPNYYLNSPTGFVVQLVAYSDMTLLSRFIENHPSLEYFSYQKRLNNQLFVILTTKVFDSKAQARAVLELLPAEIIKRGSWIKALSIIKTEITALR